MKIGGAGKNITRKKLSVKAMFRYIYYRDEYDTQNYITLNNKNIPCTNLWVFNIQKKVGRILTQSTQAKINT